MGLSAPATVINAQVITATGTSGTLNASGSNLDVLVNVSAVSGTTPSATFSVQWSMDGTTWAAASPADSFTAITAAIQVVQRFTSKAPYWRLAWTVSGTTPSFTTTVQQYDS